MKKFWFYLTIIFRPRYWLMTHLFSKAWDKQLCSLMATQKFVLVDKYYAKIGCKTVWIQNHPYASFTPDCFVNIRPSRYTIYIAYKKLIEDSHCL